MKNLKIHISEIWSAVDLVWDIKHERQKTVTLRKNDLIIVNKEQKKHTKSICYAVTYPDSSQI